MFIVDRQKIMILSITTLSTKAGLTLKEIVDKYVWMNSKPLDKGVQSEEETNAIKEEAINTIFDLIKNKVLVAKTFPDIPKDNFFILPNRNSSLANDMMKIVKRNLGMNMRHIFKSTIKGADICIISPYLQHFRKDIPDVLIVSEKEEAKFKDNLSELVATLGFSFTYMILNRCEFHLRFVTFNHPVRKIVQDGVILWGDKHTDLMTDIYDNINLNNEVLGKERTRWLRNTNKIRISKDILRELFLEESKNNDDEKE